MPLSEEEQRLLEQLEQALAADDPSLASALRGSKLRARNRRHAFLAGAGFIVGVALLMVGVIVTITPLGVAGFVVMLASAYVFLTAWRSGLTSDEDDERPAEVSRIAGRQPRNRPSSSGSFMERMEERWRRRRDTDG